MAKVGAAAGVAGAAVVALPGVSAAQAAADGRQGSGVLLAQALTNSTGARASPTSPPSRSGSPRRGRLRRGSPTTSWCPALATLARATGDVAKSQQAMGIALDVSAATGKDLGSVTNALAKGYAGNTTSLGRLVPGA